MGRLNKRYIIIAIIMSVLLLSGCDKIHFNIFNAADERKQASEEETGNKEPSGSQDEMEDKNEDETNPDTSNDDKNAVKETPTASDIQPVANKELMIYSTDANTGEIVAVESMIPEKSEVTPKLIVDKVVEAMADESLIIGVESVSTKGDKVIVSFYSDKAPIKNVGAGIEGAILDAIAQSLTENLKEYNDVIYRVEGNAYLSGHIELGIDEPYLGNSNE